jgi:hypothetical protein
MAKKKEAAKPKRNTCGECAAWDRCDSRQYLKPVGVCRLLPPTGMTDVRGTTQAHEVILPEDYPACRQFEKA